MRVGNVAETGLCVIVLLHQFLLSDLVASYTADTGESITFVIEMRQDDITFRGIHFTLIEIVCCLKVPRRSSPVA